MATSNVQVNEGQVSFKRVQGHKHDGITSSLIDTSQYSMFDFAATENSTDRAAKQSNNKKMLKTFIVSTIEERVLNPQGIRLQANAITAREIVAGTITANELSANIVLVNNVIRSTNYVSNSTTKTGWLISSNGNAEFNDVTIRGNLISGDGFYAAANTPLYADNIGRFSLGNKFIWNTTSNSLSINAGSLTLGSNLSWDGNTLTIAGNITLSNTNVGTFDNGDSLTAGNIGGIVIGSSSIRSADYDANPTTAGFLINSDGTATFNEVTVRGTINANGGVFAGFLAAGNTQVGTNINGAAGYGGIRVGNRGWENAWVERNDGSIYFNAQNLSGSNRIYMDNTNALISFGSGAFSVSNTGALTATSGFIGGITIGSSYIQSTDYDSNNGFRINSDGTAYFNEITVKGTVYAGGGEIGDWIIDGSNLRSTAAVNGGQSQFLSLDPDGGIYSENYVGGSWGAGYFTQVKINYGSLGSGIDIYGNGDNGNYNTTELRSSFVSSKYITATTQLRSEGSVGVGTTENQSQNTSTGASGVYIDNSGFLTAARPGLCLVLNETSANAASSQQVASFRRKGVQPGSSGIYVSSGAVVYSTSSDYRLKKNVVSISEGIDLVNRLNPISFDWISYNKPNKTYGFLAHELAEVVPDAVMNEKDGIDEDGNPKYQSVDLSFTVPIIVSALKESIAKIEELEARIQSLEGV